VVAASSSAVAPCSELSRWVARSYETVRVERVERLGYWGLCRGFDIRTGGFATCLQRQVGEGDQSFVRAA